MSASERLQRLTSLTSMIPEIKQTLSYFDFDSLKTHFLLPGPTGETNGYRLSHRGHLIVISTLRTQQSPRISKPLPIFSQETLFVYCILAKPAPKSNH